jgi:hypothetical protein
LNGSPLQLDAELQISECAPILRPGSHVLRPPQPPAILAQPVCSGTLPVQPVPLTPAQQTPGFSPWIVA